MKIEKEPIQMRTLNMEQVRLSGGLVGVRTVRNFHLSQAQITMLELMQRGKSIEQVVQHFISHNSLVSFVHLAELVQYLLTEHLIVNPSFYRYFENLVAPKEEGLLGKMLSVFQGESRLSVPLQERMKEIPFFRSLDPQLLEVFLKNMRVIDTPAGFTICHEGDQQRSLFVLLKGQVSVYRKSLNKKRQRLAVLNEGSVFGEVGFFLGQPRTADLVTDEKCQIVKLAYNADVFDKLIKIETAKQLQKRFWVVHALLKSPIFKGIPDDCFDSLLFSGEIKTLLAETTLFNEGDLGESCYIIIQGSLVVSKAGETIRVLGQGDCVGEIALLSNRGRRSATVRTQNEVLALQIHYQNFYQLLSQNLVLACEFEKLASQRIQEDQSRA